MDVAQGMGEPPILASLLCVCLNVMSSCIVVLFIDLTCWATLHVNGKALEMLIT